MFELTRETIAVETVGLASAGFVGSSTNDVRTRMQAMRTAGR